MMTGKQSIAFPHAPYVLGSGSVAGKKEGEGPLGKYFDAVCEVAGAITPVPGGVGPMTISMLMRNCLEAVKATVVSK